MDIAISINSKIVLKLHKPAIADKRYRLILLPSARTIAKPQERKEIALNAINRMQNQIKKPYYSHAAKYRLSSTETSNAGVRAETSSDPYNTEIEEGCGKIIPVSCNSQTKVKPGEVRGV